MFRFINRIVLINRIKNELKNLLLAIVLVVLVSLPFLVTTNQKTLFSFPKFRADADNSDIIAPFTENRKFK